MRRSTFFSLLVAAALAVLAVIAVNAYLSTERRNIFEQARQSIDPPKPQAQVVVASSPLSFGERVTAAKLKLIEWPSDSTPAGAFTSIEALVGETDEQARYVLSAVDPDEPVLSSKVTNPGQIAKLSTALTPGMKAITISVNARSGVAGFVLPGDRVDVMLTRSGGGGTVDVLLQGVRVIAVGQIADERTDQPTLGGTVTFEVTTQEAQKLALASQIGTLSLALRNISSADVETPERMTVKDLFGAEASRSLAEEIAGGTTDDGRLLGIEEAVKSVGQKIEEVEETLRSEVEEALRQRQAEEEAATTAQAAPEPKPVVLEEPKFVTVVVTKGGSAKEYKFRSN